METYGVNNEETYGGSLGITRRSRRVTSSVWEYFKKLPIGSDGREYSECLKCGCVFISDKGTTSMRRHLTNSCLSRETNQPQSTTPVVDQEIYHEKEAKAIIQHNYSFQYVKHETDDTNTEETQGSSLGITRRGNRMTSSVWEYFKKLPIGSDGREHSECLKCGCVLISDNGTTSMRRHLTDTCSCRETNPEQISIPLVDQAIYREKVAKAIIWHNYPFHYVEHEGEREVHQYLNPTVNFLTRNTTEADVLKIYKQERDILKEELKLVPGRFCLSVGLWYSITSDGYLTLTCHYVDANWVLQKKVLVFRHIPPPHNGKLLATHILDLLKEWGIEKRIFTLTVDDASYNDGLIESLKNNKYLTNSLICNRDFLYIRCGAYILNLILQYGLRAIDESLIKIRESVKYVRGSEARIMMFVQCVADVPLRYTKKLVQDVQTLWNSTYLMLESALVYRHAFCRLCLLDKNYKDMEKCPSDEEWERVEKILKFLKPFYDLTTLFSGNYYPTSNLYFPSVWNVQRLIAKEIRSEDVLISSMARFMKFKFDKYWEEYSMVLSFGIILDPRYKLTYVKFCFEKLDSVTAEDKVSNLKAHMFNLFDEYLKMTPSEPPRQATLHGGDAEMIDDMDMEFDAYESQHGATRSRSQLDLYLDEPLLDRKQNAHLNVLEFWESNKTRYPELSLMARDILSIPLTTVASETTFSHGGRIVGKFRSSILPQNVEAILCTRDWLHGSGVAEDEEAERLCTDLEHVATSLVAVCSNN